MKIKVSRTIKGLYRTYEYCNIETSTTLEIDGLTVADLENEDGEAWQEVVKRIRKAQKGVSSTVLAEYKRFHEELEELPERYLTPFKDI